MIGFRCFNWKLLVVSSRGDGETHAPIRQRRNSKKRTMEALHFMLPNCGTCYATHNLRGSGSRENNNLRFLVRKSRFLTDMLRPYRFCAHIYSFNCIFKGSGGTKKWFANGDIIYQSPSTAAKPPTCSTCFARAFDKKNHVLQCFDAHSAQATHKTLSRLDWNWRRCKRNYFNSKVALIA